MGRFPKTVFLTAIVLLAFASAQAGSTFDEYEGRTITSVEITFEGSPADPAAEAEFLSIVTVVPNTEFSAVNLRDSAPLAQTIKRHWRCRQGGFVVVLGGGAKSCAGLIRRRRKVGTCRRRSIAILRGAE